MKNLLATTAILAALAIPAAASPIDWNFQDHLGNLPNVEVFNAGGPGLDITAKGFTLGDVGTGLFGKNGGGDENGLGLQNDLSGDGEIQSGRGFVQINLDGILARLLPNGFSFQMGSTTQGEGWQVFGSQDATLGNPGAPFQFTLLASNTDPGGDEGFHTLPGGWDNYNFFYNGNGPGMCGSGCNANVLLQNFDATLAVPGPIVGAGIPGLVAACIGLVGLGARRRKNQAATA